MKLVCFYKAPRLWFCILFCSLHSLISAPTFTSGHLLTTIKFPLWVTLLASWRVMTLAGFMNLTGVTENSEKTGVSVTSSSACDGMSKESQHKNKQVGPSWILPISVGKQSQAVIIWDEKTGVYILFILSTSTDEPGKGFAMSMGLRHWHLWPGHACANKAHLTTIPPILPIRGSGKFTSYPGPFERSSFPSSSIKYMHINFSTRRNTGNTKKSRPWTTGGSLQDKEIATPDKLLGRVQDEKIQGESLSDFPILLHRKITHLWMLATFCRLYFLFIKWVFCKSWRVSASQKEWECP